MDTPQVTDKADLSKTSFIAKGGRALCIATLCRWGGKLLLDGMFLPI